MKRSPRAAPPAELNEVQVASPCSARWEEMAGDDRVRFCSGCRQNVYNLSAMNVEEAAALLARDTPDLCIRFYRRADGTLMTKDCPLGAAARSSRPAPRFSGFVPNTLAVGFIALTALSLLRPVMGERARPVADQQMSIRSSIRSGDLDRVHLWLDHEIVRHRTPEFSANLLIDAVHYRQTEIVKLLLVSGFDVNARNEEGRTALQTARAFKNRKLITFLKKHGATE